MDQGKDHPRNEFEQAALLVKSSLARDFLAFLAHNKKWWLLPIIVILLALGALAVLGGTGAAPFIYTLF